MKILNLISKKRNMKNSKHFILALALSLMSSLLWAQAKSPAATASGKIGEANISIKYSSPSVRERKIWGELVPYNKVWRAGANAATVFETDKDLKIDGQVLPAGKYSLYAIPTEKKWTIIFNSQTGQWGTNRDGEATLDSSKDVLRTIVKPKKSASFNERLVYAISETGMTLSWENLEISVPIK